MLGLAADALTADRNVRATTRDGGDWWTLDARRVQTFLVCEVPRVRCREHGILTMQVPWAEGEVHGAVEVGSRHRYVTVVSNRRRAGGNSPLRRGERGRENQSQLQYSTVYETGRSRRRAIMMSRDISVPRGPATTDWPT